MRNYIYYAFRYFHFRQNLEITIFVQILNIVEKFWKDSIYRAKFLAKLALKYWRNFRGRNTNPSISSMSLTSIGYYKSSRCRFGRQRSSIQIRTSVHCIGYNNWTYLLVMYVYIIRISGEDRVCDLVNILIRPHTCHNRKFGGWNPT